MAEPETPKPVDAQRGVDGVCDRCSRKAPDDEGATTLEWTLLLAAIALPSYFIINLCVNLLVDHYRMMTTLNALPFP